MTHMTIMTLRCIVNETQTDRQTDRQTTQIYNRYIYIYIYIWVIPCQLTQFWKISHLIDSDFDDMQCRGSLSIENNIWRV